MPRLAHTGEDNGRHWLPVPAFRDSRLTYDAHDDVVICHCMYPLSWLCMQIFDSLKESQTRMPDWPVFFPAPSPKILEVSADTVDSNWHLPNGARGWRVTQFIYVSGPPRTFNLDLRGGCRHTTNSSARATLCLDLPSRPVSLRDVTTVGWPSRAQLHVRTRIGLLWVLHDG